MADCEVLDLYLKTRHATEYSSFTDVDKKFILRSKIQRESIKDNDLLADLGVTGGIDKYRRENLHVKNACNELQEMYVAFSRKNSEFTAFNGSFIDFIIWWCSECDKSTGVRHCYYCGVDEKTLKIAFDPERNILYSKKPSFSGTLQIERLNPDAGYNSKNCRFACTLCNNAKSDMLSSEDFKKYVAPGFTAYWKHLKEKHSL